MIESQSQKTPGKLNPRKDLRGSLGSFLEKRTLDPIRVGCLDNPYIHKNQIFQVMEGLCDGFWIVDLNESGECIDFLYNSKAFGKIFGYDIEDFQRSADAWLNILHHEDIAEVMQKVAEHVESGGRIPVCEELRMRHKDGSTVWILARIVGFFDEKGEVVRFYGIQHNITHQKETQLELARSNEELAEFAHLASHDLSEPLRTVRGFSSILSESCHSKLTEEETKYLGYVTKGMLKMQHLVDGLLNYSRLGGAKALATHVDIQSVVDDVIDNLGEQIQETGATVLSGSLSVVRGHFNQLVHLFQNLISNAIKFRSAKPPIIKIECKETENAYEISVSDNGIGIEKQFFGDIFKIYKRLHSEDVYQGTGMGLAVVKKIVENHQGKVWVTSKLGEGTTFHFTLRK